MLTDRLPAVDGNTGSIVDFLASLQSSASRNRLMCNRGRRSPPLPALHSPGAFRRPRIARKSNRPAGMPGNADGAYAFSVNFFRVL